MKILEKMSLYLSYLRTSPEHLYLWSESTTRIIELQAQRIETLESQVDELQKRNTLLEPIILDIRYRTRNL